MDLGLNGRCCVVTGGSGGIGAAVGRQLCAEGASVLLVGRDDGRLAAAAAAAGAASSASGGSAATLTMDVCAADAGERIVAAAAERFGRLDVLVNGAGMTTVTAVDALTDADWQAHWELHVMAPMRLMRAAIPEMVSRGWGRVVNVSSSSGKRPSQRNVAYSVTKAGLLSLSRAYADAYAARGVLVNAVTPGPVGADLWLAPGGLVDQTVAARGGTAEQVIENVTAGLPVRRLGRPEEIADVIVFLCSEAAANVAGAAWSVDGGAVPVII